MPRDKSDQIETRTFSPTHSDTINDYTNSKIENFTVEVVTTLAFISDVSKFCPKSGVPRRGAEGAIRPGRHFEGAAKKGKQKKRKKGNRKKERKRKKRSM